VQISAIQGTAFGSAREFVGSPYTEGTIHAKYAVFDPRISIVGSFNIDPRRRTFNSETAIVIENGDLSRQLADKFYKNDLDLSRQITLEDTKAFSESKDAIYQLQKQFGIFSDDEAITMLNQRMKIDVDELKYKLSYVSKFMKVLPGRKVAGFCQAENRFDTAAIAELYSNIPGIR